MSCGAVRKHLTRGAVLPARLREHLAACADCAGYAERLERVRLGLRDHRLEVEPDAGFAARVASRLERGPGEALARAALRLLPAGVALAAVLLWLAWSLAPDPGSLFVVSPRENPLVWVADATEPGS